MAIINSSLTVWFIVFWLYYFILNFLLIPNGFTFKYKRYGIHLLSTVFCIVTLFIFKVEPSIFWSIYIIPIVAALFLYEKFFISIHKKVYINKRKLRKENPIPGRFVELIFQQIMLFILLNAVIVKSEGVTLQSSLIFAAAHIPIFLIRRVPLFWKVSVVTLAFFGGIMFSTIIYYVPNGILLAYFLHITFYFFYGLFTGEDDQVLP